MSNRVLIYSFPFFLAFMEWFLRASLQVESRDFLSPTIAAAALGLLLPLTGIRNRDTALTERTRAQMKALGCVIVARRERTVIDIVWMLILVSLAIWVSCLIFVCKPAQDPLKISPIWYAFPNYFLAVLFCEIREAI